MIEETNPPSWAIDRACALSDYQRSWFNNCTPTNPMRRTITAFATHIAHTEEPPVEDPILTEARKICAEHFRKCGSESVARSYEQGEYDNPYDGPDRELSIAMTALKRGIEISVEEN